MSDEYYIMQADSQFDRARKQSTLASIFSFARGVRDEVISLEEARRLLKPTSESFRGVQTIEIAKIVGSEGRYADFNRRFLPRRSNTRYRWSKVHMAYEKQIALPAIQVYELGGYYFVRDGNHRVSVAIQRGMDFIEASVTSLSTEILLDRIETVEDLKRAVLDYEHDRFLEILGNSRFPPGEDIRFTATGRFDDCALHIACHRSIVATRAGAPMDYQSATASWYRTVYRPVVQLIRDSGVLEFVPERTAADFYVWLIRHWEDIPARVGAFGSIYRPNRGLRRRFSKHAM